MRRHTTREGIEFELPAEWRKRDDPLKAIAAQARPRLRLFPGKQDEAEVGGVRPYIMP